jgi:hypothetical protein
MQAALQRYLGDLIDLQQLQVSAEESTLRVMVQYVVRRTQQSNTAIFARSGIS